jgi:shikimate dehydrogenase
MKKAYVLGSSVKKSLSPLIFKYWFKQNKIEGEYLSKEIEPKNFDEEIKQILEEDGLCGFNVTIPFKELIIKKIDKVDEHSKKIGAVNFVSKIKGKWVGKNTDWIGFSKAINVKKAVLKKRIAVVIGYGGSSRAIIYALKKENFEEIKVFNRTEEKTHHLKKESGITPGSLEHLKDHLFDADLVVNTTPINSLKSLLIQKEIKNSLAFDVVYRPQETNFLSHFVREKRLYGISMLIYQAAPCFEEWFGVRPNIDQGLINLLSAHIK